MCELNYINWKTDNSLAVIVTDKATGERITLDDCDKIEINLCYKDSRSPIITYSTEGGTINIIDNKAVVYITRTDSELCKPLENIYFIATCWTANDNFPDGVQKRSSEQVYILTYKTLADNGRD